MTDQPITEQAAAPPIPPGAAAAEAAAVPPVAAAAARTVPLMTMYDRARAAGMPGQPAPPKTDIALVYADSPNAAHPWSVAEMNAQTARYFLPCWVAAGHGNAAGAAEAQQFLMWLHNHHAPRSRVLVYDLETRGTGPDLDHEHAFRHEIAAAGHWVMLYGSTGNLFKYPETGGGYWAADPPPPGQPARPHMFPHGGVVATQWRFAVPGEDWDLSVVNPIVRGRLWDRDWTTPALARVQALEAEAIDLGKLIRDYAPASRII